MSEEILLLKQIVERTQKAQWALAQNDIGEAIRILAELNAKLRKRIKDVKRK
jgi:hypothetical protein